MCTIEPINIPTRMTNKTPRAKIAEGLSVQQLYCSYIRNPEKSEVLRPLAARTPKELHEWAKH